MRYTIQDAIGFITAQKPALIYLSGKTSTGKTTFCRKLMNEFAYHHIELDKIVHTSIVDSFNVQNIPEAFVVAYRNAEPAVWRDAFIEAARLALQDAFHRSPVIVEGAIANPTTLYEIFKDRAYTFVYLHPVDTEEYAKRITQRFIQGISDGKSGLPQSFWKYVSDDDIEVCKIMHAVSPGAASHIKDFARDSILESKKRLESFQSVFGNIIVVEV